MNWPLVIFGLGLVVSGGAYLLRLVIFDRLDRLEARVEQKAKDHGERTHAVEDRVTDLEKWRAKVDGADEKERDLSGVVRR